MNKLKCRCGAENNLNAKNCYNCGLRLKDSATNTGGGGFWFWGIAIVGYLIYNYLGLGAN